MPFLHPFTQKLNGSTLRFDIVRFTLMFVFSVSYANIDLSAEMLFGLLTFQVLIAKGHRVLFLCLLACTDTLKALPPVYLTDYILTPSDKTVWQFVMQWWRMEMDVLLTLKKNEDRYFCNNGRISTGPLPELHWRKISIGILLAMLGESAWEFSLQW